MQSTSTVVFLNFATPLSNYGSCMNYLLSVLIEKISERRKFLSKLHKGEQA
jgi:membrane protein YqaA with SNARE-associated domain